MEALSVACVLGISWLQPASAMAIADPTTGVADLCRGRRP